MQPTATYRTLDGRLALAGIRMDNGETFVIVGTKLYEQGTPAPEHKPGSFRFFERLLYALPPRRRAFGEWRRSKAGA